MSKRHGRKKKEQEEGQGSASITAFLYGSAEAKPEIKTEAPRQTEPTEAKPVEKKVAEELKTQPTQVSETTGEEAILSFIKARGSVTKNELMSWAKTKGLRTADVLRAIEELTGKGRIVKRLNDRGDLIYVFVK